jgi:RHH-type transcriptional regulator, rel operon repressor / antitoxin RelB
MQHNNIEASMASRATVTFHTSPEVKARLELLADRTRRSKSFLTNEAVERYLAEEEDFIRDVEAGIAEADAGNWVEHDEAKHYIQSLGTDALLPLPTPRRI